MKYILEDNEMYNSIIKEFQLSNSVFELMKEPVYTLAKVRMNLFKLLKLSKINMENVGEYIDDNEKDIIVRIKSNEANIEECEKKQLQLKDKIKLIKQEVKEINLQLSKLENIIKQEQQEGRKLRETLHIFIKKEKFKTIKKILISRYREVFLKYSNELSIENKILECNKRKEKIRKEKESLNNIVKGYTRKITADKKSLAEMRKNIISMNKSILVFEAKLQIIRDYKEMEKKIRCQIDELKSDIYLREPIGK